MDDPPELRKMRLDIGLGRFDQGFESQAMACGMAPEWCFPTRYCRM